MKKIIFILLLFPFVCSAQKLVKNEVDKFTGKSVKKTSKVELTGFTTSKIRMWITAGSLDGRPYLDTEYTLMKGDFILEESPITFLLDNGETVILTCVKSDSSKHKYIPAAKTTLIQLNPVYSSGNPDDFQKLKDGTVTDIRIALGENTYDVKISKKGSAALNKALKLIL